MFGCLLFKYIMQLLKDKSCWQKQKPEALRKRQKSGAVNILKPSPLLKGDAIAFRFEFSPEGRRPGAAPKREREREKETFYSLSVLSIFINIITKERERDRERKKRDR